MAELTYPLVHYGTPEAVFYELSVRQVGQRVISAGLLTAPDVADSLAFLADLSSVWLSIGMVSASGHAPRVGV